LNIRNQKFSIAFFPILKINYGFFDTILVNYDGLTTQAVYLSDDTLSDSLLDVRGYFLLPTNPVKIQNI
jgi:hypothetical protein